MKTIMSLIAAANKLGIDEAEVRRMMKSGSLEVMDREGGLPGVSEESVLEFWGEVPVVPVKKRAGRKPNIITYDEVKEMLHIDDEALEGLIKVGELKKMEKEPGTMGVTKRSVDVCKKKMGERDPIVLEDDYIPLLGEEDDKPEAKKESVKVEELPSANETTKPIDNDGDESVKSVEEAIETFSIDDLMQKFFPGIQSLDENMIESMVKKCECDKPQFSRKDMREVADVAYMKGKLAVYESMGEFKRKERA